MTEVPSPQEEQLTCEESLEILKRELLEIVEGHYSKEPETPLHKELLDQIKGKLLADEAKSLHQTVDLSIAINEAVTAGAEMNQGAKDINHQSNGMAAAIQELTASVENIAENTETVANETAKMSEISQRGMTASEHALQTMSEISTITSDAVEKIITLSQAAQKINGVLGFISDIADQTNLLALNATIEAARAGEAGKGFAVVAGEVKELANKTNESTKEIAEKIKFLTDETDEITKMIQQVPEIVEKGETALNNSNDEMKNISSLVMTVTDQTRNVADILAEQKTASTEIAEGVVKISQMADLNLEQVEKTLDAMDLAEKILLEELQHFVGRDIPDLTVHLAKSDHVIWKKRLANMLVGRESLNPDELADHHTCRLGKWYYAIQDEKYTSKPAYRELEGPHELVHKHGIEAARLYRDGNLQGAIDEVKQAEAASVDVLRLLDQLLA